jgi:hypothetical protein
MNLARNTKLQNYKISKLARNTKLWDYETSKLVKIWSYETLKLWNYETSTLSRLQNYKTLKLERNTKLQNLQEIWSYKTMKFWNLREIQNYKTTKLQICISWVELCNRKQRLSSLIGAWDNWLWDGTHRSKESKQYGCNGTSKYCYF